MLKFIEDLEPSTAGNRVTIKDAVKEKLIADGDVFLVQAVKCGEKCMTIMTADYIGFLWYNETIAKQLLEALPASVKTGQCQAMSLVVMKKAKRLFSLALDDEQSAVWSYSESGDTFTQNAVWDETSSLIPPPVEVNPLSPKATKRTTPKTTS